MLAHAGTPDELVGELFLIAAVVLGWIGVSRLRGRSFVHLPKAGAWGLALLALAALAGAMVVPVDHATDPVREPAPLRRAAGDRAADPR